MWIKIESRLYIPRRDVPRLHVPRKCVPRMCVPRLNVPRMYVPRKYVPRKCVPRLNVPRMYVPRIDVPRLNVPRIKNQIHFSRNHLYSIIYSPLLGYLASSLDVYWDSWDMENHVKIRCVPRLHVPRLSVPRLYLKFHNFKILIWVTSDHFFFI
jgi:allophanate hydrolase subunit 1